MNREFLSQQEVDALLGVTISNAGEDDDAWAAAISECATTGNEVPGAASVLAEMSRLEDENEKLRMTIRLALGFIEKDGDAAECMRTLQRASIEGCSGCSHKSTFELLYNQRYVTKVQPSHG